MADLFAHLLFIDLSEPLYLNDSAYPIEYDGKTWLPYPISDLDDIESTTEMRITDYQIKIGSADQSILALIQEGYMNRQVIVHDVDLDKNMNVTDADHAIFEGTINYFKDSINTAAGTTSLTIYVTDELGNFEAPTGRQCNAISHQAFYPNDTAMRHAVNTQKPTGEWGHEDSQ